jgi:aerobic carbon-monoxide dehydrogenase medium subunit
MKPPPFTYHRPGSRDEVDALLAEHGGDAKVLAGGQSLVPLLNLRLVAPAHVVDLGGLPGEPDAPVLDGDAISVGPLVRHVAVERSPVVAEGQPLLAEVLRHVAHPAIRSRGTLVGSIAHADPASELPAAALLLDATVSIRGIAGTRTVPIDEFVVGPLETALEPGEWVEELRIPADRRTGAIEEFSRRHGDYAICGVVAVAGQGSASLSFFGLGDTPARHALDGAADRAAVEAAVESAVAELDPQDDIHASASYRAHLARRLGTRAALRALGKENGA